MLRQNSFLSWCCFVSNFCVFVQNWLNHIFVHWWQQYRVFCLEKKQDEFSLPHASNWWSLDANIFHDWQITLLEIRVIWNLTALFQERYHVIKNFYHHQNLESNFICEALKWNNFEKKRRIGNNILTLRYPSLLIQLCISYSCCPEI